MPTATIGGFAPGDTIDLAGLPHFFGDSADLENNAVQHKVLQITAGGQIYDLQLDPAQDFAGKYFHLAGDQGGTGTTITEDNVPCYCPGTLILTGLGKEVPVERLTIGDNIMTMSGVARPIKWIGKRSYGGRFLLGQKHILPVCIKAGSLAENTPRRDLWISPHHAMYLEGVLIEARDLVNGINIVQPDDTAGGRVFPHRT